MKVDWKGWGQVVVLIVIYVMLGNSRSLEPNPFIPGATIAVNMIVPVLGGILFGARCGFLVGMFGTMANTLSPAGSVFEMLAIVPHSLMGLTAGILKKRYASPISSMSLLVGHMLNILMFTVFSLIPFEILTEFRFWTGILYETFIGVVAIIVITSIYRIGVKD